MKPADCLVTTLDRSDEVKGSSVNVRIGWRTPRHLWLYCSLMGVPPTAFTMPVHDPPVAWRGEPMYGIPVIVHAARGVPTTVVGGFDGPVLDSEPGRSPVRP